MRDELRGRKVAVLAAEMFDRFASGMRERAHT